MKMAIPLCKSTAAEVFQEVIDDVMNKVRELVLEHGVNEEVLQKLKQTWETKFLETNVVDSESYSKAGLPKVNVTANGLLDPEQLAEVRKETAYDTSSNKCTENSIGQDVKPKMVIVKLLVAPLLETKEGLRTIPMEVPAIDLSASKLFQILTDSVVTAAKSLPKHLATKMLQQQVNAIFNIQPQNLTFGTIVNKSDQINDNSDNGSGSSTSSITIQQSLLQKPNQVVDTSDDESDYHDALEETIDVPDCDEDVNEEPLGSDDDGSVQDAESTYENVIYCKYEKILNSDSKKWKFHVKHGIMKLNGQEYVFQNVNGTAQF